MRDSDTVAVFKYYLIIGYFGDVHKVNNKRSAAAVKALGGIYNIQKLACGNADCECFSVFEFDLLVVIVRFDVDDIAQGDIDIFAVGFKHNAFRGNKAVLHYRFLDSAEEIFAAVGFYKVMGGEHLERLQGVIGRIGCEDYRVEHISASHLLGNVHAAYAGHYNVHNVNIKLNTVFDIIQNIVDVGGILYFKAFVIQFSVFVKEGYCDVYILFLAIAYKDTEH
jgi:hypothetical protein